MSSGSVNDRCRQLVGRRHERAQLVSALEVLRHRTATFVALSGEPGIGKTRLFEELAAAAEQHGCLVLKGRGADLEGEMPFAVWVDALDEHVAWLGADRLRRMLGDQVGELARVLPSARAEQRAPEMALPDERYRAHWAVRALLERIARARSLVVLLDDVHWADGASLELIMHLLRRPLPAPVLIGLAFRSGRLSPSMLGALEAADRDGHVVDVRLGPLAASDVDRLLGEGLAPSVRHELHDASGGNPFYLLQLARWRPPADARKARNGNGAFAGVPPAVAAALGQEIDALTAPARLLAQGAAVAGDPVELELAVIAADLSEPAALDALDEPLSAGLLQPSGITRRYRFRHPIVRRAVYESAGEGWRLAAHARTAVALADRKGSPTARAHHLEHCAQPGDEDALALFIEAGREAAPHAPDSAVRWYRAALRVLSSRPQDAQRRLELLVALARAFAATGRLEQALDTWSEALALVPESLSELRVGLLAACAASENLLGRHHAAHARLLSGLRQLPENAAGAAGALQAELAADALFDSDFAGMAGWAQAALTTARGVQDRGLTVVATALLCFARYGLSELAAAAQARDEAAETLDELPDEAVAGRLDAPYYLGFAEFFCERYDDAIRHFRRGIAISRATGQGQLLVPMLVGLAHALEVRGRLQEALEVAEAAVEGARLADNRQCASWALVAEGWIAAMTGDFQRAEAATEEAVQLLAALDESVLTVAAHADAAVVFLETARPERCLEEAHAAGAPDFARIDRGRRAWLFAALARAELARGQAPRAGEWLARAQRALHGLELPYAEAAVLHVQALLALDAGDPAAAAQLAQRAAERADAVGAVIHAARSAVLAGRALAAAGAREAALTTLADAEANLTAYGAHRLRDEAARELRRLGRRITARQRRTSPSPGSPALSGREREIAELVALGRTNREIAAELFLSEKTVEGHLSHVFTKFGVHSRAAVATTIARTRTTPP
jgi:DNA-binding NarL/FixJ family response regulator